MDLQQIWVFAMAALVLNLTPGNDMIYVMSRSAGQGVKAGIFSALGIMGGCMVHMLAAVAGLSALLAKSAFWFGLFLYAGAAYLVYLGIRMMLKKNYNLQLSGNAPLAKSSYAKIFRQGMLTNVLNPKVALFFLAFLPQFVNPAGENVQGQILFLGTWFNVSGTLVNLLVAFLFGKLGNWWQGNPGAIKWQQRISGLLLVILGIKMAVGKGR